ncbi:MAG: hypothetical protein CVV52_09500 [Spirochaetae bacterium HGW-Spirochaetae-8]|jgi:hypothetical protein|nr:MAG: hypothetical protein CVV52_09500 [Spirochaetae bacterium HGW-Spirochaetae-8]
MKTTQKCIVCLILSFVLLSSLGATATWEPYLGLGKGKTKVEGERVPFFELALGTSLGSRATIETFLMAQPLSNFPHMSFDADITETESAFAMMTGARVSVSLFKDAFCNPMLQAGLGGMIISRAESTDNQTDLFLYFYSSIATGFEVDFSDSFKILILSGYRFVPHDQVIGIENDALSSRFSSVSFRASLD